MAKRNLVVIGASAGGIEVLQQILAALPRVDAAILIVVHISPHPGSSVLPHILQRASNLPALHPEDGTKIKKGTIYVAPPDYHMIVDDGHIRLTKGARENRHRPAIDPLFRSAAVSYGPRVIGVILSGALDDGTIGLRAIHARGGEAIVQDPSTAMFPSMPTNALGLVPDAHVLPATGIATKLVDLLQQEILERAHAHRNGLPERETRIAELDMSEIENENRSGRPSSFACPDCGGVLWEIDDPSFLRFRCRVGHAYTARHLAAQQRNAIETALWSALRALEESGALYKRMAERAKVSHHELTQDKFEQRADSARDNARVLRDFLLDAMGDSKDRLAEEQPE